MVIAAKKSSAGLLYPETDNMGEHELRRLIAELLRPLLARFLSRRDVLAHAGADQFIYWEEGNPGKRLAPDVYVLPGVRQDIAIRSWKIWETGVVPSFVLEVASEDYAKDYEDGPALYGEMGVKELVVFDPRAVASKGKRVRWQVYRRVARRGLVRVDVSQGDRVRSKVLGAWLRCVGEGDALRVRLGMGADGAELFPTEAEDERAAKEQERAGRLEAEAEVARLRELLAKGRSR